MSTGNLLILFMSQQMDIAEVMELQQFFYSKSQMLTEYMPPLNTPSSTVTATKIWVKVELITPKLMIDDADDPPKSVDCPLA